MGIRPLLPTGEVTLAKLPRFSSGEIYRNDVPSIKDRSRSRTRNSRFVAGVSRRSVHYLDPEPPKDPEGEKGDTYIGDVRRQFDEQRQQREHGI